MAHIITDADRILDATGIDARRFITTLYMRDSMRGEKPLLIELENGKRCFCTTNLEKANVEYNNPKNIDEYYYYITYRTFSDSMKGNDDEYESFMDSIKACIPSEEKVSIENDMMVSDYHAISEEFNVSCSELSMTAEYYVYELHFDEVVDKISSRYDDIAEKAIGLFKDKRNRDRIRPYIENRKDNRFELFNEIFSNKDIDLILLSSPLNVQEATGIPFFHAKESNVIALYDINSDILKIVSEKKLKNLKPKCSVNSLKEALSEIEGVERIGYEPDYLTVNQYELLGLEGYSCIDVCGEFREKRERMVLIDLPSYIIAAKSTMHALDNSIEFVEEELKNNRKVTELDAFNKYQELRNAFVEKMDVPLKTDIYQAVTWCGNRSIYCGYATEFEIDDECKTFRMDIGDFVMDAEDGYIYAASDSCRTLCNTAEIKEVYLEFTNLMRETFSVMKPGIKCSDIWKKCVQHLYENQEKYKKYGLMPENQKLEDIFTRNVGHAMSKQTRTARMLAPDSEYCIEEGMVGTIEIPFGYKDIAFSVEEMWFMAKDGVINLSIG